MMNDKELIIRFMEAFTVRNFSAMKELYSRDVQFFDPLFGYLSDEAVVEMWQFRYAACSDFKLTFDRYNDEGDGYHTCLYCVQYKWGNKAHQSVKQYVKAYFRISDNKIIEHSDGYSLHQWCSQRFGWTGNLLGWNRFYQQSIKNKIRKEFISTKG